MNYLYVYVLITILVHSYVMFPQNDSQNHKVTVHMVFGLPRRLQTSFEQKLIFLS